MVDEWDESGDREPLSWRVRRWAAPLALAAAVATSIAAVQLFADDQAPFTTPRSDVRYPRFMLTVQQVGGTQQNEGPAPWFEVRGFQSNGPSRPVDSVERPPSAGQAAAILAGPNGTFVVAATRKEPCESRFYLGELSTNGKVKSIEPLPRGTVPALVAGLALSPKGDRLAYTTAPCTRDGEHPSEPQANVTVLDIDSGHRRTWTTAGPSVIGEIVWARDGHTLGYALSGKNQEVAVHALDTDAQGTDLRAARVLFRQPSESGTVRSAVMNSDGRTGHGMMEKHQPPSLVIFSFSEGKPMRVTKTIPRKANLGIGVSISIVGEQRYACLNGIDSFGRVVDGDFSGRPPRTAGCEIDYAF